MNALQTISTMCRFCLSKDQEQLLAVTDILDSTFTIEIIQLFTGVQLTTSKVIPYAVCENCRDVLKTWFQFRNTCLHNDVQFKCTFAIETSEKEDENVAQPQHLDTQLFQIEIMLPHEDIADDNDTSQASVETLASDNNTDQSVEEPIEEIRTNDNERATCASSTDVVQFETPFELTTHVELDEKTYPHDNIQTCPQFGKEDQSHEKTAKSSNERNWQLCVTCGKLVKNLKYHMGTHASDIASYACPHCPMKMRNQTNLARHIQAVHLKKIVISCEPCGRGFSHINSYKAHMRSRHGIGETYQCETCLKTFKQPSGYKKHVSQAHNNERNFVCAVCGKPFKDKQALNLHRNVHSTARPFACGMCPKRFKGASAKRAHELTHTGIVFKCPFCDKSYQYKSLLNLHVKKHHP